MPRWRYWDEDEREDPRIAEEEAQYPEPEDDDEAERHYEKWVDRIGGERD